MVLEMLWIRRRIVRQAGQRIVDALRRKQRERPGVVAGLIGAVHDVIVGGRQIRHIEHIAQGKACRPLLRDGQIGV